MNAPLDRHARPLGVLRLSLTARCNLACPYCCPDSEDPPDLLTLPERVRLVTAAVGLGVHTLRLTGGEPLLHRQLEELIAALRPLRQRPERDPRGRLRSIALTSNGVLLSAERAVALRRAGLDRITLSLDGADGASVGRMAGLAGAPSARAQAGEALLARVLAAIEHARAAGFDPDDGALKLNAVIRRGDNDDQLLPLAGLARQRGLELRLIEYMDVGNRNGWTPERVVPASEMVERIAARWPLEPVGRDRHGTACRWRYQDRPALHLATVASISAPFCGDCNRLRVTADGRAFSCLFAADGVDLRPWLRGEGADDVEGRRCDPSSGLALRRVLEGFWRQRQDRWSEERHERLAAGPLPPHAEMAYLGG